MRPTGGALGAIAGGVMGSARRTMSCSCAATASCGSSPCRAWTRSACPVRAVVGVDGRQRRPEPAHRQGAGSTISHRRPRDGRRATIPRRASAVPLALAATQRAGTALSRPRYHLGARPDAGQRPVAGWRAGPEMPLGCRNTLQRCPGTGRGSRNWRGSPFEPARTVSVYDVATGGLVAKVRPEDPAGIRTGAPRRGRDHPVHAPRLGPPDPDAAPGGASTTVATFDIRPSDDRTADDAGRLTS